MVLKDPLVETVELIDCVFGYCEAVLIKNRLAWIVDHLSLNVLGEGIVRLSLSKHIHLFSDDLDVVDVL